MAELDKIGDRLEEYYLNDDLDKLDAIYMWARFGGHTRSYIKDILSLRYGLRSKVAIEEVNQEFEELLGGFDPYYKLDSGEELRDFVVDLVESSFIDKFRERTEKYANEFGVEARKLAFLIYRDVGDELREHEEEKVERAREFSGRWEAYERPYRIIFGSEPERGAVTEWKGLDDLVEAGLAEYYTTSSRKHTYPHRVMPAYSIETWLSFPEKVDFPELVRTAEITDLVGGAREKEENLKEGA